MQEKIHHGDGCAQCLIDSGHAGSDGVFLWVDGFLQELVQLCFHLFSFFDFRMIDDAASCHDHLEIPQSAKVFQRVPGGDDHICGFSFLDGSGDIPDTGELSASAGRGIYGERVGDADVSVEVVKLAPEVVLSDPWTADVIAENDRDIVFS